MIGWPYKTSNLYESRVVSAQFMRAEFISKNATVIGGICWILMRLTSSCSFNSSPCFGSAKFSFFTESSYFDVFGSSAMFSYSYSSPMGWALLLGSAFFLNSSNSYKCFIIMICKIKCFDYSEMKCEMNFSPSFGSTKFSYCRVGLFCHVWLFSSNGFCSFTLLSI